MLNKLLEQIQMMIGYQKSKKIGRFITLFFAISVGTYLLLALSLLILWLYGWGHMEDPFEMKEFLKIYFPAMSCVSGVIGTVFGSWLKDQSILGPFDPVFRAFRGLLSYTAFNFQEVGFSRRAEKVSYWLTA